MFWGRALWRDVTTNRRQCGQEEARHKRDAGFKLNMRCNVAGRRERPLSNRDVLAPDGLDLGQVRYWRDEERERE
jgi:hypothetical protein